MATTNVYGADGYLAQTIDVGFRTNSYAYSNALVYSHTDERALTVTNTWDSLNRLIKVSFPDGTYLTNAYEKLDLVKITDRMGFTRRYDYNDFRQVTHEIDVMDRTNTYTYCDCGVLSSTTDPLNHTVQFHYQLDGLRFATVYADNFAVTNRYDLLGRVTNVVDSAGSSVTNWFNNQGLTIAASNAVGRVQAIAYDILDRATNSVDANSVSINTTYDDLNRARTRSYPDGGVESFGYTLNITGLTSYTNQLNQETRYVYDAEGRKVAETNANIEVTQFNYSAAGDLLTLKDGKNQVTSWNFDTSGRVTNKVDAANNVLVIYNYDPNNRLTNRWSSAKGNTVYRYDPVGNLTNVDYPVSPDLVFGYDPLNRLTNMVDGVGTNGYTYDAAGQLLNEDGPWSDDTVNYTNQNRLRTGLSVQAPNASTWSQTCAYDAAKRLTNVTSQAGKFGYTYKVGQASSLSRISLPNGSYITNEFDSEARLLSTTLKNSGNTVLNRHEYSYNLGNQRTQQVFTVGNYVNYTYDNIGQLKTANGVEPGGGTNRLHEQFGYAYDTAGNLNFRTNNALTQIFNVNSLNALTTVSCSGTLTVAGTTTSQATNVTVNTSNAILYVDYTFASTNHSLADGNNTFTAVAKNSLGRQDSSSETVNLPATSAFAYDLNGNMLTNGTRYLEYDDENQLIRITEPGAWRSEFAYDGKMRRRIRKEYTWSGSWVQTNEVRYVYDRNLVIQERDVNNLAHVTYTRGKDLSGSLQAAGGIGGLLARTDHSTATPQQSASYYRCDGNGNITALINTNQIVVACYEYDPFGNLLSLSGPLANGNRYRFSSKEFDPLVQLYYYGYRFYSPALQRWSARDPIGELGGVNIYCFVRNNSIQQFDPLGNNIFGDLVEAVKKWCGIKPAKPPRPPLPGYPCHLDYDENKGIWVTNCTPMSPPPTSPPPTNPPPTKPPEDCSKASSETFCVTCMTGRGMTGPSAVTWCAKNWKGPPEADQ